MKAILFLLLLVSSCLPLHAQQAPAPTAGQPRVFTHADTARVVHTIFKGHRIGSVLWTATGLVVGIQVLRVFNSIGNSQPGANISGYRLIGVGIGGVIPIRIGIGKLARFGRGRELEVLQNFNQGRPLPLYVVRRLRLRYFEE